ncbi:hypothetical protein M1307_03495, partial [Patescibacteria group bacterium]|nr:hypothetical protein [Patescibacteria group bacterium]
MGTGELTEVPINVPAASPAVVIRPEVPAEIPVGQEGPVPAAMAPEVASESVLVGQSEAGLAAPVVGSVEFNLDNEIAKLNAESFAIDRDADEAASINSLKEKG